MTSSSTPPSEPHYPTVVKPHILPRLWQANFAVHNRVQVHDVRTGTSREGNIDKVGTRLRFYRRTRPNGEEIDDVEWSMQLIEDKAAPLVREIRPRWPLTLEDKGVLAEFFGLQYVRGPRFFAAQRDLLEESLPQRIERIFAGIAVGDAVIKRQTAKGKASLSDKTRQLVSMLQLSRRVAAVFGSMHWTLLRFPQPWIALSDEPIVLWPINRTRAAATVTPAWGPLTTIEVRVPLAPDLAILMSWFDAGDRRPVPGKRAHASSINAFTIAQADKQWMHLPGHEPPIAKGNLAPLTPGLLHGYSPAAAEASRRRATIGKRLAATEKREVTAGRQHFEVAWMEPEGPPRRTS